MATMKSYWVDDGSDEASCSSCGEVVVATEFEWDEWESKNFPIFPDECPACGEHDALMHGYTVEREDFYADL